MRRSPCSRSSTIEAVDDEVVGVDGRDGTGAGIEGDAREVPVIGAEIEHVVRLADGGNGGGDERRLGIEIAIGVVAPISVARPGRGLLLPRQPVDGRSEIAQLGVDQRGPEAGSLELGADVALAVGVGVPPFGAGVQPNVGEHALAEAPRFADDRRRDAGGDAVDVAAEQRLEGHVTYRLDVERIEEELAELPIARPRLTSAHLLERADVDEHRLAADELHVVGAGVLGDQRLGERLAGQRQLQPGCVAAASRTTTRTDTTGHRCGRGAGRRSSRRAEDGHR